MTTDITGVRQVAINNATAKYAAEMVRVNPDTAKAFQASARALLATRMPVDGETPKAACASDIVRPDLALPLKAAATADRSASSLIQLLGNLTELLGAVGMITLKNRIDGLKSAAESRQKNFVKQSAEFEAALAESEAAVTLYGDAQQATEKSLSTLNVLKQHAKQVEQKLAGLTVDDPARPEAVAALTTAQGQVLVAAGKWNVAVVNERRLLDSAMQTVDAATKMEARNVAENSNRMLSAPEQKALGSSAARLGELMAKLIGLVGKSSDANIENDQEMATKMKKYQQATAMKAATDYETQVQKAEDTARTMGCVGKIVGALVMAVSIIAIPFTGGASLALAVLAIGLATADVITSAITGGTSLTDMAMAPVMKNVIQPMIQALSKAIVAALVKAGVPQEKAEFIGGIIAAVIAAIAMIVVMVMVTVVARGPAAAKVFSRLSKPLAKMVGKLAESGTATAAKAAMKPLTSMMTKVGSKFSVKSVTAQQTSAALGNAGLVLDASGKIAQTTGSIIVAEQVKMAAENNALLVVVWFAMRQFSEYIQSAIKAQSSMVKTQLNLMEVSSQSMQSSADSARRIARARA